MHKYSFRVFWSDGDNGFVAICPELPGVSAIGATEDEAIREAKIAQELYVEDMLESGERLPEPFTAYEYSGQTRLRMSKALHRTAAELADEQGVSLNQFINDAVAARVGAEDLSRRMVDRLEQRIKEMEARLVQQTVKNNRELAVSLVHAWEHPAFNAITETVTNAMDARKVVVRKVSEESVEVS